MLGRYGVLVLAVTCGCAGDEPDVEPLDSTLRDGEMTAEFDGAAFEPEHGLLYYAEDSPPGRLLLSTAPLACPYVDFETIVGIHVSFEVSSIDPGADESSPHVFWKTTETDTQDYRYDSGSVMVTDSAEESFSGALVLGGAEASLEGTFEVGRCPQSPPPLR